MFEMLVAPPTHGLLREAPARAAIPLAGLSGSVRHDRLAVFAHLQGHLIRCDAGHLWVTLENDGLDHVLDPNQYLFVATPGKVIIGGNGRYTI